MVVATKIFIYHLQAVFMNLCQSIECVLRICVLISGKGKETII